jgi:DNA-binding transcriptional ArsR family regulator
MPDPPGDLLEANLLKALGHPLRLRLLEAITDQSEASPVTLARQLDQPLTTVSKHVRLLRELGFVELSRTAPRRGAVEHFYRAVQLPFIDDAAWERLPTALRRGLTRQTFRKIFSEAAAAGAQGGFDDSSAHTLRVPLAIDEQGRQELSDALYDLLKRIEAIEADSEARRRGPQGSRGAVVSTCLGIVHFWMAKPVTPTGSAAGPPGPHAPRPTLP